MEPVLSRHLRHAIKSVLHFTSVGPEIMDLKATSQGIGNWDSLMMPIVVPPRTAFVDRSEVTKPAAQDNNGGGLRVTTEPLAKPSVIVEAASVPDTPVVRRRSQSVAQPLEPSLSIPVETSGGKQLSRSVSLSTHAPQPAAQGDQQHNKGSSSPNTSPIVIRGFSSTSSPVQQSTAPASSVAHSRSNTTETRVASPVTLRPRACSTSQPQSSNEEHETNQHSNGFNPLSKGVGLSLHRLGPPSSSHTNIVAQEADIVETLNSDRQQHQQPQRAQSRSSRIWTRVRKVVQGDFRLSDNSNNSEEPRNNTVYMTAGSVAGATASLKTRSMSETHLSSRPVSTSSTASSNLAMPSFSSSALSLLSEDQMSPLRGPVISTSGLRESSTTFETPPETASCSRPTSPTSRTTSRPTSPTSRPTSPISRPTSPVSSTLPSIPITWNLLSTTSQQLHNLPGLARKSSTKSSAAAAELTTAESRVSQFMYSDQHHPHDHSGAQRDGHLESDTDFFVTPNALDRSNFKNALQMSTLAPGTNASAISDGMSTSGNIKGGELPLGRSRSTSDAQHVRWKPHRQLQQGALPPTSYNKDTHLPVSRPSLDQQTEPIQPASPTTAKNVFRRPSISPFQSTDSGLVSPSELLSGISVSSSALLPSKEERRKSAISFGGYFSNHSEASAAMAARRSRYGMDHSVTGLEMDLKGGVRTAGGAGVGEVIHMRRTSFFDRATSPPTSTTLASLSSLLQSSLTTFSQTSGPTQNSLLQSSSNTTARPLTQHPSHSTNASVVSIAAAEAGDPSRPLVAISSFASSSTLSASATGTGVNAATGTNVRNSVVGGGGVREMKKKVTPLKITPLLLSGLSSVPSPMFGPLSSSIPRSLATASTTATGLGGSVPAAALDRYFFGVDQVHEWNVPSYGRIKLTDHAPLVFHAIREQFHYTLADMDEALSQPMTVMKTPGKSDAIFFASHNHGRFLLKTLRGAEPENLRGFLSDYLVHIQRHPNTLLPRYLGMYTFERMAGSKLLNGVVGPTGATAMDGIMAGGDDRDHHQHHHHHGFGLKTSSSTKNEDTAAQRLHLNGTLLLGKDDGLPSKVVVVVLANVFDTPEVVHERYDFKGSNVGRMTLTGEKPPGQAAANGTKSYSSDSVEAPSPSQQPAAVREDLSHLTLKEMDFQKRVSSGETQLIHLGPARRSDVLSQLEEDTALLRKHGFMDYSMLVGIRLVPKNKNKRQQQQQKPEETRYPSPPSSSSSSSRYSMYGSVSSRGSEADNSNLDSDDDNDNEDNDLSSIRSSRQGDSKTDTDPVSTSKTNDFAEAMDRVWRIVAASSRVLTDEQRLFWKELGEKAQETFREIYAFGEDMVVQGAGLGGIVGGKGTFGDIDDNDGNDDNESRDSGNKDNELSKAKQGKKSKQQPVAVELKPVKSDRQTAGSKDMEKKNNRQEVELIQDRQKNEDTFDMSVFQTVRNMPRARVDTGETDAAPHPSRRAKLTVLVDGGALGKGPAKVVRGEQEGTVPDSTTTSLEPSSHPSLPQPQPQPQPSQHQHQHWPQDQLQQQPIWSQGVASEGLPHDDDEDGYEAVYYFGLIDILQKYNLVKWLERNIKGANVRLLGGASTPTTPVAPTNGIGFPISPSPPGMTAGGHPGRSTPSSSFLPSLSSSSIYQLLPQASASESSLLSTSAPLDTGIHSLNSMNPTLSVLLEDSGSDSTAGSSNDRLSIPSSTSSSSSSGRVAIASTTTSLSSAVSSAMIISQDEGVLPVPVPHASEIDTQFGSSLPPPPTNAKIPPPRVSSSAPFAKSIARLSQYSHHSQSSQQSQYSHLSGRSRDSRLSFETREGSESYPSQYQRQQEGGGGGGVGGIFSGSRTSLFSSSQTDLHSSSQKPHVHYQVSQQAEVSVEEPGRYAERLVEFMRGAIV
ncbi:Phosphatidylinositol 5-phosphate 4-kinase type-2 alpha [Dissophora globulifera]|nr:Phosphatidylinositol 5-phosphate 4-kinase type-2 alpha [Dissophora globulifera]